MSVNRISQTITNNISNGAARAMLYGVGLKRIDLRKYLVGIGSMQFDINPCNNIIGVPSPSSSHLNFPSSFIIGCFIL